MEHSDLLPENVLEFPNQGVQTIDEMAQLAAMFHSSARLLDAVSVVRSHRQALLRAMRRPDERRSVA